MPRPKSFVDKAALKCAIASAREHGAERVEADPSSGRIVVIMGKPQTTSNAGNGAEREHGPDEFDDFLGKGNANETPSKNDA